MPARTVDEYLAGLPDDRRAAMSAVRKVILAHLPRGYAEGIQYGAIGYFVPHALYPAGYHCKPSEPLPLMNLASPKSHMALHLMCVYGDDETRAWFESEWKKTGKRLDMGKACLRFKKLDDLPLELIGRVVARVPVAKYVARIEALRQTRKATTQAKPKAKDKPTTR